MDTRAGGPAARAPGATQLVLLALLALLAACTGPPGRGTEPPPRPDGAAASATAELPARSQSPWDLTTFLSESDDFVASTHPGLLVVTPDGFEQVADDPTVDRDRLVPPLSADRTWKCLPQEAGVVCLGLGHLHRFEPAPGPRCGALRLERHRVGHALVAHRTYGSDGRLTQQITHETYEEHYGVPGSNQRTGGGSDVYVIDDLAPDGSSVRTRRVVGAESYQYSFPDELIWVDHGELRVDDPDGQARVTVVSGRWDRIEDPAAALERLCDVFE
jgi:hypothetical protein